MLHHVLGMTILEKGVIVQNSVFKCFFESALPQPIKVLENLYHFFFLDATLMFCSVQAADMVVTFIRRRMRKEGIQSCLFLPGSFVEALRGEYQQIIRVQDIAKFSFSSIFRDPCFANMTWSDQVQVLFCPFQVDGRHWIGL